MRRWQKRYVLRSFSVYFDYRKPLLRIQTQRASLVNTPCLVRNRPTLSNKIRPVPPSLPAYDEMKKCNGFLWICDDFSLVVFCRVQPSIAGILSQRTIILDNYSKIIAHTLSESGHPCLLIYATDGMENIETWRAKSLNLACCDGQRTVPRLQCMCVPLEKAPNNFHFSCSFSLFFRTFAREIKIQVCKASGTLRLLRTLTTERQPS